MIDYTLSNFPFILSLTESQTLENYPPVDTNDWKKSRYSAYKNRIKRFLVIHQFDRCAYCRALIEPDGRYEPLDHVVPKSVHVEWMFEIRNLVLCCNVCNNGKWNKNTLSEDYQGEQYPHESEDFLLIQPHFDQWSDHLDFEDDLFIVANPNSKGDDTIRICGLDRYHVIINRSREINLGQKQTIGRALHRLRRLNTESGSYQRIIDELLNAIDHCVERVQDNPNFR